MRALTVRQPWASAIFKLRKDVENRTWYTDYRGLLLIHAGLKDDKDFWASKGFARARGARRFEDLERPAGCIIGCVELRNVVTASRSTWAERDAYHWVLATPALLPEPIYCSGRLGLWIPDSRVLRALKKVL